MVFELVPLLVPPKVLPSDFLLAPHLAFVLDFRSVSDLFFYSKTVNSTIVGLEACRLEPSPQGTRSSEAEEGKWICPRFNSPRSSFWVCIRSCTQLFQRVSLGGRGQATRQMKGLAYLKLVLASDISISSGTYVQWGLKQRYERLSIYLYIYQRPKLWTQPCDYLMNVMQLLCDKYTLQPFRISQVVMKLLCR